MDKRVLAQGPAGVTVPLAHHVEQGTWWPDNWITPAVQLRLRGLKGASSILVRGFQPALAPRQIDNRLTLEAGGARDDRLLEWGGVSETVLQLAPPVTGDLELRIEVENGMASDALVARERGVLVTRITVHQAA